MSGMLVDWDYIDTHMSKSFLKIILFFNVLMLVLMISFFGNNFIKSAHDSIYELVFFVIVIIVYFVGRDTARLMYYIRMPKIVRRGS